MSAMDSSLCPDCGAKMNGESGFSFQIFDCGSTSNFTSELCKLRSENKRLKDAIQGFVQDFDGLCWGSDGDCGAAHLVAELSDKAEVWP